LPSLVKRLIRLRSGRMSIPEGGCPMRQVSIMALLQGIRAAAVTIFATVAVLACKPDVSAPRIDSTPQFDVTYNHYCPPEVSEEDCEALTEEMRETLAWDLEDNVQWNEPGCAAVANQIENVILYGDVRSFPDFDNMYTMGEWEAWLDAQGQIVSEQVSWNRGLFDQGWQSQRLMTTLHEGYHEFYQGGGEGAAESFAWNCINW
jgi:hypothetical protein